MPEEEDGGSRKILNPIAPPPQVAEAAGKGGKAAAKPAAAKPAAAPAKGEPPAPWVQPVEIAAACPWYMDPCICCSCMQLCFSKHACHASLSAFEALWRPQPHVTAEPAGTAYPLIHQVRLPFTLYPSMHTVPRGSPITALNLPCRQGPCSACSTSPHSLRGPDHHSPGGATQPCIRSHHPTASPHLGSQTTDARSASQHSRLSTHRSSLEHVSGALGRS